MFIESKTRDENVQKVKETKKNEKKQLFNYKDMLTCRISVAKEEAEEEQEEQTKQARTT
jgi:hypothetical protein